MATIYFLILTIFAICTTGCTPVCREPCPGMVVGTSVYADATDPAAVDMDMLEASETTILIEDNDIFQNNRAGIRIRGSLPVHINRCSLHDNGRAGISGGDHARIYVTGSALFSNWTGGMDLNDPERVACRDTLIFRNHEGGIRLRTEKESGGSPPLMTVTACRIYLNGQGGINIQAASPGFMGLNCSDSSIFSNKKGGIRMAGNTRLTAWDNFIYANGTAGIATFSRKGLEPRVDIFQNRLFFNHGAGIFVQSGITGCFGISNNWIYNNYRVGIGCGLDEEAEDGDVYIAIFHNTIVSNGYGEAGAGIRNDSSGTVIIRNNIIAYNARTGLMVEDCGDAYSNLLFANGDTSSFDEDADSSFLFERLQYAGCPGRSPGDLLTDPLFTDPDRYDFSLSKVSPAAGAGVEIDLPYIVSFGRRDIGALITPSRRFSGSTNIFQDLIDTQ